MLIYIQLIIVYKDETGDVTVVLYLLPSQIVPFEIETCSIALIKIRCQQCKPFFGFRHRDALPTLNGRNVRLSNEAMTI